MEDHDRLPSRRALLLGGRFTRALNQHRTCDAHAAAVRRLIADAEWALTIRPPSVLDKLHTPPSGDKRDYFSLSIYFWPDPSKPDGLPYQPRDGQVNPQVAEYDYHRLELMTRCVDTLACAYALTGNERFAEHAARFLRTWFLDPRTAMHPNMLFAQYIPGENIVTPWPQAPARYVGGSGGRKGIWVSFGGVIEDLCLLPLTDAIDLLASSPHWSADDQWAMRDWYRRYTHWLETHQHGADEAATRNNHGSWYWAGIACFRRFCGELDAHLDKLTNAFTTRLNMQIEPDGSQPAELGRATAQGYVAFALCAFVNLAEVLRQAGRDVWTVRTNDGRSLRTAVDWFLPYLTGDAAWTWQQIKPFDPTAMVGVLAACADRYDDAKYSDALQRLALSADDRHRLLFNLPAQRPVPSTR